MGDSNVGKTAAPAVISRREAIVGALALAAGSLIATRPDVALAANGQAMVQGTLMYDTAYTALTRYDPSIQGGINDVSYCILNHNLGDQHIGVYGSPTEQAGAASTGVYGLAVKADHYGVQAENLEGGTALRVIGKAEFQRSGRSSVSKGKSSKTVTVSSGVSTSSMILATLQGSGGSGVYLKYVRRLNDTSFRLYLTKHATSTVTFAWMIVETPTTF